MGFSRRNKALIGVTYQSRNPVFCPLAQRVESVALLNVWPRSLLSRRVCSWPTVCRHARACLYAGYARSAWVVRMCFAVSLKSLELLTPGTYSASPLMQSTSLTLKTSSPTWPTWGIWALNEGAAWPKVSTEKENCQYL